MGFRGPSIIPARTRLQGLFVWEHARLPDQREPVRARRAAAAHAWSDELGGHSAGSARRATPLAVSAVVIVARLVWFFTVAVPDPRARPARRASARDASSAAGRLVLGLERHARRGVARGRAGDAARRPTRATPFPERDLIIFLTFAVIFATLVAPGAVAAGGDPAAGHGRRTAPRTRRSCARVWSRRKAALEQLDALAEEEWTRDDTIERMRARSTSTASGASPRAPARSRTTATRTARSPTSRRCRRCSPPSARRSCELRNEGTISNEVMNRVVRELDLEESRLEI